MGKELEEVLGGLPPQPTVGGGLPPQVPRYEEAQAKSLVQDMLSALSYIHANGIVHRDIKLENCKICKLLSLQTSVWLTSRYPIIHTG